MPIYGWKDKKTGKQLEVYRQSFDDYLVPPDKEEALEAGVSEEEFQEAEWEKLISSGIKVTRGDNWTGSKGNW